MVELTRTASFRLAIRFGGLFVAAVIAILSVAYLLIVTVAEWKIRQDVTKEQEELQAIFARSGLDALTSAVRERAAEVDWTDRYYLLQSARGEVLEGNLARLDPVEAWQEILPPGNDPDEPALARGVVLDTGHYLLTGESLELVHDAAELFWTGAAWTFVITTPLAFLGGYLMSAMVLRRIAAIGVTTERIRKGNLAERISLSPHGDEFDALAGHINAMLDSIERLNQSIRQVSSGIAHDLRTPLTHLRQKLERALAAPGGEAAASGVVEASIEEVDRILDIFSALLRIGEIDAGTRRVAFTVVDLSALLTDLADIYAPVAQGSSHTLGTDIVAGITCDGDRALLVQMFTNLIENAIVHTRAGSRVLIALQRSAGRAVASVADNGGGIPAESRQKVLERFVRLEGSGSKGSGLGLSLVDAIARLHGFELRMADNAPGLQVELRLPDERVRTPA